MQNRIFESIQIFPSYSMIFLSLDKTNNLYSMEQIFTTSKVV